MDGPQVRWDQVLAWRMGRQLLRAQAGDPVEVARQVAGVQAQVTSSAEQAVWLRSGAPAADVRRALWHERSLVKTWAMRGTLHWLAADEYPMWVAALRDKERNLARAAAWERYHGMTLDQLRAVTEALADVVGAEPITRQELADEIGQRLGDWAASDAVRASFGGSVLKTAAAEGYLCFGPSRDRNVTFVSPASWVPGCRPGITIGDDIDAEEAKAEVARRFLAAWGPATADDLARWWGVPPAAGKRLLRLIETELAPVDIEGSTAWVSVADAGDLEAVEPLSGHIRFLPGFDNYVLGPRSHRAGAWPPDHHDRISRAAGWISPTVVVDGRVVAVWRSVASPRVEASTGAITTIEVESLVRLGRSDRVGIARAASEWKPILGPIRVSWVTRVNYGKSSAESPDRA